VRKRANMALFMAENTKMSLSTLDKYDLRLLEIIQQNNQMTCEKMGEQVGLSASAVRRRLKNLRDTKIIVADVSIIDQSKIGISVIVSVRFDKESHATYESFKLQMKQLPEVTQCYTVSGEVDFILMANFQDLQAYEHWIGKYLLSNPAIGRSDTNIVYSRIKFTTALRI
jgi:Lrp/AsnC family leucine-responsive transcriptional regulator